MKIGDYLKEKKKGISFEFFPPKTDKGRVNLKNTFLKLSEFSPSFVSVTYGAGGGNRKDAMQVLEMLKELEKTEVLAHLTCIGFKKEEIFEMLARYKSIRIENILALRGDPPKDVSDFDIDRGDFKFAKDLIQFIKQNGDFSIGVAVYPEGHPESPNIEKDIEYTIEKIDSGADFAITQMFFKNSHFYNFMDKITKKGVKIPILTGIMPITNFNRIKEFAFFCKTEIPQELEKKFAPFIGKPLDEMKAGVEYAVSQCEDLIKNGFSYFHFYTLNKSESVSMVLKTLFA